MKHPMSSLCETPGEVGPQRVRGPGTLGLQERFQPEARLSDQQTRNPEGTKVHTEKWDRMLWWLEKLCSLIRGWAEGATVQVQFTVKSCAHSHLPGVSGSGGILWGLYFQATFQGSSSLVLKDSCFPLAIALGRTTPLGWSACPHWSLGSGQVFSSSK